MGWHDSLAPPLRQRCGLTGKGGTGRYAHAHGETKLYGTFDRQNYALVIQTAGKLTY